jgi:hypothetical protein
VTPRAKVAVGALLVVTFAALGIGQRALDASARATLVQAPRFEVDPLWPKPLPNHWVLGNVIGVGVDANDHVFIVHRNDTFDARNEIGAAQKPPLSDCCVPAPPVLEFDPAGNLVKAWGGTPEDKKYDWPTSNHGISIDNKNNIWIGGNGACPQSGSADCPGGTGDSFILKFTHDGKFLMEIGEPHKAVDSRSTTHFGRVAKISFDFKANEAFIADGYGNRRVAVLDMNDGRIKRFWGAYGETPTDTALPPYDPSQPQPHFRNPVHCADPSADGLVYVCDRVNDRLQVFKENGEFVKEKIIKPQTKGDGSVWDIAFSKDPQQKYIFMADGKNERVYVMDRQSLDIITEFGDGGRQPGQWFAVHSIATDSKGNIYTTETYEGKRIQKFIYKGMASVEPNQGVVWPKR